MSQNTSRTRYPGLASFTAEQCDLFFGRKQEIRDLFNLISVERNVVLFSKSGYGKTSLLQAGVMPLLYGKMMVPVSIRFGTADLTPEQHFSIQLETAWLKFQGKTEVEAQKLAKDSSVSETFWEQVDRKPFGNDPARFTPLFVFDQFEELFTLYPEANRRTRFITDLADIMHERLPQALRERIQTSLASGSLSEADAAALEKAPPMRFVFSIRSDMLHYMDELSEAIPYILRSRYQLFGLNETQAREAITAPAALEGASFGCKPFGFTDLALTEILTELNKKGEVESFQLQTICQALEEQMLKGARQKFDPRTLKPTDAKGMALVSPDYYGGREGIDRIIEDNYNRRIESLAETDETWPEQARRLLEDVLMNKNDRRQSVDIASISVDHALLDELERQRLLRKEPRLDSFYYEISHDTWLKPILKSKLKYQEEQEKLKIAQERADADKRRKKALLTSVIAGVLIVVAVVSGLFARSSLNKANNAILLALEKERQAFRSDSIADFKTQKAHNDSLLAVMAQGSANIASIEAKFQQEIAEIKTKEARLLKLEADQAQHKANTLLLASRYLAKKEMPPSWDVFMYNDTLDLCGIKLLNFVSFENMKYLKALKLCGQSFTLLPAEIGKLTNLTALDLSYNENLNRLPPEIGNLTNLSYLNLNAVNNLACLPPEIGKLKNLKTLHLSLVDKLSALPPEIGNLTNLSTLYLGGSNLTIFPSEISNLKKIEKLTLQSCNLTNFPVVFTNLTKLSTLDVSSNNLKCLPPEIGNLKNLNTLSLSNNNLDDLPPEIGNLKNLNTLYLLGNNLTEFPPEISKLADLNKIYLSSNNLTTFPLGLTNLTNLTTLDLSSNNLKSLPPEISNLKNLENLFLSGNELTSLPLQIVQLQNLNRLDLTGTQISDETIKSLRKAMPNCAIFK